MKHKIIINHSIKGILKNYYFSKIIVVFQDICPICGPTCKDIRDPLKLFINKISIYKTILLLSILILINCICLSAQNTFHTTITQNSNTNASSAPETNKKKYIDEKNKIDQKTLDFWKDTLKFGTSGQKRSVITYIQNKKISIGENLILEFIKLEKNMGTWKMMVSALVSFSNAKAIPYILKLTEKTNSDDNKIFALTQLGKLKYRDSYKHIMDNLDSENELLIETTLRTLAETEAKETVDALLEKLKKEKNNRIRTQIILTLANIKSDKTQNTLISIFTNEEEKELDRGYAVTGLGYIKNKKSYDILIKHYNNEPPNIKMRIIDALGNLGYPDAVGLLIESLKDDDKNIRFFSIKSLGKLKAKKAIDIIKYKEDYDPEYKVRLEAKKVLIELKELKGEK